MVLHVTVVLKLIDDDADELVILATRTYLGLYYLEKAMSSDPRARQPVKEALDAFVLRQLERKRWAAGEADRECGRRDAKAGACEPQLWTRTNPDAQAVTNQALSVPVLTY